MTARLVLATDLDGTMAHGDRAIRDRLVSLLRDHDAKLVYVTGRTPVAVRELAERVALPEPDVLIADVGTSVLKGLGPERVDEVEAELERLWPGGAVVRERLADLAPELVEQEVEAPRRVSYWIERVRRAREQPREVGVDAFAARLPGDPTLGDEAAAIGAAVARQAVEHLAGLRVDVLMSANVFLDVLPHGVDKGTTLRRVLRWLGAADEDCVVAGDSLNDLAMLESGLRGIAVANCEPALRRRVAELDRVYQAVEEGVGGVLEGLRHHGHFVPGPEGGGEDGE